MAIFDLGSKIIVKPNNSLSPEDGVKLLAAMALVAFLIACGFARIGAWLVLPFAGLEILAFAYAFHVVYLHADDFESITIVDDRLVVEKRNDKKLTTTVFQRYWAQVNVRSVDGGNGVNGKCGLFISSHGNEVEFGGSFINDEQRAILASELRWKLKNIN
ncbi:MAG: DUF2244 domain-containing protein [Methylotenera sp.]|nr:DUF2244 domain-containing protein [Methylotenera sp.]